MKIAGIDPGSARIGYALVTREDNSFHCAARGTWELSALPAPTRLVELEKRLAFFLSEARPDRVGVEKLFFSTNRRTAMGVAEARGIILLTVKKSGIPFVEIAPNEVKRAITGDGNASKAAVAKMVRWITGLADVGELDDTTDAIAIAIAASGGRG